MPLILNKRVSDLRPADYNPRAITDDAVEHLQQSLHLFGFAKPVIFRDGDLLLAGHQRIRVSTKIQLQTVPAFLVESVVSPDDEARFNQLHNGTDMETIDHAVTIGKARPEALRVFTLEPFETVRGNFRSANANLRQMIARLLTQYGNWGGIVATMSGAVVSSPHYALACKQLGMPVRTYRIEDGLEAEARRLFGYQYGQFSYDHLPRHSYIQAHAQLRRLRKEAGKGARTDWRSKTYEQWVIPAWQPHERLIDFGCGQGDYLQRFQREGRLANGIEFFYKGRVGKSPTIDRKVAHHMIDQTLDQWARKGGFDIVVCDSVLNSIDSDQAERDVVTCCHALARPGGRVYISGRTRASVESQAASTKSGDTDGDRRYIEFLDEKGFTAVKRGTGWFFQKYHRPEQVRDLFARFPFSHVTITFSGNKWSFSGRRSGDLPDDVVRGALGREFELPWPGGRTVGRSAQALAAFDKAKIVDIARQS